MNKIKTAIESISFSRTDQREDRISDLKDRNFEITQRKRKHNKKEQRKPTCFMEHHETCGC